MIEILSSPEAWLALATLTLLELVLGIDNIIFISILVDKLPPEQRDKARRIGLGGALIMRIGLLLTISWIMGLKSNLFEIMDKGITGRDLILILGGVFLLWKSVKEIHQQLEGEHGEKSSKVASSFAAVIAQIMVIDLVFSLDSIITAVGMVKWIEVMMAAVVLSALLMMVCAGAIGKFVSAHPSIKMLALAFLVAVGTMLVADGFGHHVPKGYIYFAMAFSMVVEMLNIRSRKKKAAPVQLHSPYVAEDGATK